MHVDTRADPHVDTGSAAPSRSGHVHLLHTVSPLDNACRYAPSRGETSHPLASSPTPSPPSTPQRPPQPAPRPAPSQARSCRIVPDRTRSCQTTPTPRTQPGESRRKGQDGAWQHMYRGTAWGGRQLVCGRDVPSGPAAQGLRRAQRAQASRSPVRAPPSAREAAAARGSAARARSVLQPAVMPPPAAHEARPAWAREEEARRDAARRARDPLAASPAASATPSPERYPERKGQGSVPYGQPRASSGVSPGGSSRVSSGFSSPSPTLLLLDGELHTLDDAGHGVAAYMPYA